MKNLLTQTCMIKCMQRKEVRKVAEKTIAIRVNEETFKKVKLRLAENGMTLKDYIIKLIEQDLQEVNHSQVSRHNY